MNSQITDRPKKMNVYKINKDKIFWRRVENETVILNIDTGIYYTLDEISSIIWDVISTGQSAEQAVTKITDEYNVEVKVAEKDVKAILSNFQKERLIEMK